MGGAILARRPSGAKTVLPEVGHEVTELCVQGEVSDGPFAQI
jgi:hypothetical protein